MAVWPNQNEHLFWKPNTGGNFESVLLLFTTAKTGKELVLRLRIVLRTFARVENQDWCYAMRVRPSVTKENALLLRV